MVLRRLITSKRLISLAWFLAGCAVFGLIYAQSPLYTSNQNAYFLHGMADAGFGYLSKDWLATRLESMPVFTWLVYLTAIIFHSKIPFYIFYTLIMGVYLASMFGIMNTLFDLRKSKTTSLVFVTLFLVAHSAALRFILSRVVSSDSTFLFEGGVAGQRILGQVFQPSVFGVFLVLSIYLFLREHPFWSLIPIAVAIYFHPIYLLGGALLTIAYMWILFRQDRNMKRSILLGLSSLVLVTPALIYTLRLFSDHDKELAQEALDVLVNFRNPQHALLSNWFNWTVVVQGLILLSVLYLTRKMRLGTILLIVTIGMLMLTIIQVITGSEWLALIFPWRISVLLVPMATTFLIALAVTSFVNRWKPSIKAKMWLRISSLAIIVGLMVVGSIRFKLEVARQQADPALPIMKYVADHKTAEDVYMIPSKMENFRLVTGAPILVDFKSTPDQYADVMEWYQRLQWISWFYNGTSNQCKLLNDIANQYGVTQVVVQRHIGTKVCSTTPIIYRDENYTLYAIPAQP